MKMYIPNYSQGSYPCVVVQNATTVRAYKEMPYNPSGSTSVSISYRDFYYTSNYTFTDNNQSFHRTSTLPQCLSQSNLTSDFYYRNDLDSIFIIFLTLFVFIYFIPYKLMARLFGRWLRV